MYTSAVIVEGPTVDDSGVRTCVVRTAPRGMEYPAVILPPAGGVWEPFATGSRVGVVLNQNDPSAGVYVVRDYTTPPQPEDPLNYEVHAREDKSIRFIARTPGEVRLGTDENEAWQRVMLYDRAHSDLMRLQHQMDLLVGLLNGVVVPVAGNPLPVPVAPVAVGVWTTAMTLQNGILWTPTFPPHDDEGAVVDGGQPAVNVKAQVADDVPPVLVP